MSGMNRVLTYIMAKVMLSCPYDAQNGAVIVMLLND
jgi:hypothetical protein